MAYTLVPTELIVDGAVTSAKLDTNISISGTLGVTGELTLATHMIMGDNDKIKIGAGGDLEIYHDGSNSYISNSTGNIYLADTNGSVHIQAKLNEESIVCTADGAVSLYHDNAVKLATSSAGATVTGTLAATLSTTAQPNITSVGTLSSLTVSGDATFDTSTLKVDSTNNRVGIGTASPSYKLDLNGAMRINSSRSTFVDASEDSSAAAHIFVSNDGVGDFSQEAGHLVIQARTHTSVYRDIIFAGGINNASDLMRITGEGNVGIGTSSPSRNLTVQTSDQTDIAIIAANNQNSILNFGDTDDDNVGRIQYNHSTNLMTFRTNTADAMHIDSGGTLLLGQTTANANAAVFELTGKNSTQGTIRITPDSNKGSEVSHIHYGSTGDWYIRSASTSGKVIINDAGGNVGIGTSSPAQTLHVSSSGATSNGIRISNSEGSFEARVDNGEFYLYDVDDTRIPFLIDTSGNVGIGETSLTAKLHIKADGSSILPLRINNTASGTASSNQIIFQRNGTNVGYIASTGSSTSYNTSSDYRLKENVDYDFTALDRVAQLKPARFNFIADADTTVDGFLAHEVQDIVPEAISGEKDAVDDEGNPEYQGIDQSKLVPLLTKAIQEQQTIIDDLKSRIETLEG